MKIKNEFQVSFSDESYLINYSDDSQAKESSVIRTGKLFQAGEYSDKNFNLTPEEMIDAVNAFKPADIDVEHIDSIFDGTLGKVTEIWPSEDGWSLMGKVEIPKWLDENVLKGKPVKVSATWNRNKKTLDKLALVLNPRITDAALVSAFAESADFSDTKVVNEIGEWVNAKAEFAEKSHDGKWVIQDIHNMTARSGAICSADNSEESHICYSDKTNNKSAEFLSKDELDAIQKVHDATLKAGAKCNIIKKKESNFKEGLQMTWKEIKALFKAASELPDDFNPEFKEEDKSEGQKTAVADNKSEEIMIKELEEKFNKEKSELDAKIAELTAKIEEFSTAKVASEQKITELTTALEAEKAKVEEFKSKAEAQELEAIDKDAETFADNQIRDNKAYPAEKNALIAAFRQAALDDKAMQKEVTFSDAEGNDVKGSRVDAIKAVYAARIAHTLTKDYSVSSKGASFSKTSEKEIDEAKESASKFAKQINARMKNSQ